MPKILTIIGTRPEAIKMAPIIEKIKKDKKFDIKVCSSSQHKKMLSQVLNLFKIDTDFDLNIMSKNQSLNEISSKIFKRIDPVLDSYNPDLVLVHGDTTTTLSAAISAFHKKIKIGHVEAGLRTKNIYSPWPEEANRCLTSSITSFHFAPTQIARKNLINEGVKRNQIVVTGNTVIDALQRIIKMLKTNKKISQSLQTKFKFLDKSKSMILVTGHRRENFGEGIENICKSIISISRLNSNVQIVYPVHLNPQIKQPVQSLLKGKKNIFLIEPQDYLSFCYLMLRSRLILSDSGGIQEEAITLKRPVLVMREFTERQEALKSGAVKLVGSSQKKIVDSVNELLRNAKQYNSMILKTNPYGNGKASEKILNFLKRNIF
ncbi:MAG: UDP-N-acetylglucosamine 2-epimerase (non-hydrolyzing) [Gammaproteobacteria bacterium]|nr:UDP-N-acetylglucosamine 2-epimerase (non-hydrolyzing) [Gammaproteobacteria bacterium]